jgi:hypothetical protein
VPRGVEVRVLFWAPFPTLEAVKRKEIKNISVPEGTLKGTRKGTPLASITLPYVQQKSANQYRYRRKVPPALRDLIGKREIVIPLGRTPAEAMRRYDKAHAEAERMLSGKPPAREPDRTALERYQWGSRTLAEEWGTMAKEDPGLVADIIEGKYRLYATVDEDGAPGSYRAPLSDKDAAAIQALSRQRPEVTLTDAVRLYVKDRVEGKHDEIKDRQRVDRVAGHIRTALGRDPTLASLTRSEAREVKDYMLAEGGDGGKPMKPATAHRYLNTIRAIITMPSRSSTASPVRPTTSTSWR